MQLFIQDPLAADDEAPQMLLHQFKRKEEKKLRSNSMIL